MTKLDPTEDVLNAFNALGASAAEDCNQAHFAQGEAAEAAAYVQKAIEMRRSEQTQAQAALATEQARRAVYHWRRAAEQEQVALVAQLNYRHAAIDADVERCARASRQAGEYARAAVASATAHLTHRIAAIRALYAQ